jgi:hypothetical protein
MNDMCIYLMQLRGQVDEGEINATSPLQMTVERTDATSTLITVRTDQSGLIGLLRHLHGLGFVLISVSRADTGESAIDQVHVRM